MSFQIVDKSKNKHVDVVIISWAKTPDLLTVTQNGIKSCLNSEQNITFHIWVIESNPDVNYNEFNYPESEHTINTIHPVIPFGYHRYLNIGIKRGKSPYIALCNSDLTFEKGWVSNLILAMEAHPQLLSASPWCPQTQGDNTPHLQNIYVGYNVRGEIAGWCIFQQRKIYDIIGELDETFEFWYCDNDYAMELQKHKIQHFLLPNSIVNHHHNMIGKTAESLDIIQQNKLTIEQEKIFNKKWSDYISQNNGPI